MKMQLLKCSGCSQEFEKDEREIKRQRKNGRVNFYCSKTCFYKFIPAKKTKYKDVSKECVLCGKDFIAKNSPKGKKCCSSICSSEYSRSFQTEDSNKSRSEKIKTAWEVGKYDNNGKNRQASGNRKVELNKKCIHCDKSFSATRKETKYCSISCSRKRKKTDGLAAYRVDSKFVFALSDYPDKFDFSLIQQYGWYSPTNKKNNLGGVSRDHMVSVKYGYENNIDPFIIAHPANCELVLQKDNFTKKDKCSITLEELLERIKNW